MLKQYYSRLNILATLWYRVAKMEGQIQPPGLTLPTLSFTTLFALEGRRNLRKTQYAAAKAPRCSKPQAGYSCSNGARLNPRICVCRADQLRAARKKADIVSEASLC